MNYERLKRVKKIMELYMGAERKDEELSRKFNDWLLSDRDSEEKDLAMYMLFEEIMAGNQAGREDSLSSDRMAGRELSENIN